MPLNIRRHQQKPPAAHLEDEQLNQLAQDQYEKMLSKRGVDDRVEIITDPIGEDLATAEDDIDTAQADIVTNATAIALKLQTHSYTEKIQELTVGATGSWTEVALSAYGVQDGDLCTIWMTENNTGNTTGVRKQGSALERRLSVENDIVNTMQVVATGATAIIEVYRPGAAYDYFLIGYQRFNTS